jgi:hypothetical protein
MATTTARDVLNKHREQQSGDSDDLLADGERALFETGGSIGVTLTATGRNVHDLDAEQSATVCVYSDAIVIVPGGDGDE